MKNVSRYILVFKGLSNGKHSFTFEIDDSFFGSFEGSEIEHGKLTATVLADKQSTLLQLQISIRGDVLVECDRCLEILSLPVCTSGNLSVKFGKEEDYSDEDIIVLDPAEANLDLSQYFFDCINLALPPRRIHTDGQCNPDMLSKLQSFIIN